MLPPPSPTLLYRAVPCKDMSHFHLCIAVARRLLSKPLFSLLAFCFSPSANCCEPGRARPPCRVLRHALPYTLFSFSTPLLPRFCPLFIKSNCGLTKRHVDPRQEHALALLVRSAHISQLATYTNHYQQSSVRGVALLQHIVFGPGVFIACAGILS